MIDFCSHGIRKCVPSFTTCSCTPDKRSKITARVPPLTSYMATWPRETARKTGTAHFEIALRPAAMMAINRQSGVSVVLWSSTFFRCCIFCRSSFPSVEELGQACRRKAPTIDVLPVHFPSPLSSQSRTLPALHIHTRPGCVPHRPCAYRPQDS